MVVAHLKVVKSSRIAAKGQGAIYLGLGFLAYKLTKTLAKAAGGWPDLHAEINDEVIIHGIVGAAGDELNCAAAAARQEA
jgi:hypothetical protein